MAELLWIKCFFGNNCERRDRCSYLHPNPKAKRKKCFFGHECKQKDRCSYLHPKSNEEPENQKEEVDNASHVGTKNDAVSTAGQAPIGVRNISRRVGGSHSQVMETRGQFLMRKGTS